MRDAETATVGHGRIENCEHCPDRAVGPAVGSRGDAQSPLVLVGEAPGKDEIRLGRPFVGRAGQLLGTALNDAGIDEASVFIANSIACRPVPIHPRRSAVAACHGRLVGELTLAPRSAILALGATALASLTGRYDLRILQERGRVFESEMGPIVATLHPARVLRRPDERPGLVADLAFASRLASAARG